MERRAARILRSSTRTSIWSGNHASIVIDRTCVMCTPKDRWHPEQFKHRKIPRLALAQVGSARRKKHREFARARIEAATEEIDRDGGAPRIAQSAQKELAGWWTKSCRILWWILSKERA